MRDRARFRQIMTNCADQLDGYAQEAGLSKSQFSDELRAVRDAVVPHTYDEPCRWTGFVEKTDARTAAQRLADVLAESHREDTSNEFRLGLLQGALAVALPEFLLRTEPYIGARIVVNAGAMEPQGDEANLGLQMARELVRQSNKAKKRRRDHA